MGRETQKYWREKKKKRVNLSLQDVENEKICHLNLRNLQFGTAQHVHATVLATMLASDAAIPLSASSQYGLLLMPEASPILSMPATLSLPSRILK